MGDFFAYPSRAEGQEPQSVKRSNKEEICEYLFLV